jgi:hypothetical protein
MVQKINLDGQNPNLAQTLFWQYLWQFLGLALHIQK